MMVLRTGAAALVFGLLLGGADAGDYLRPSSNAGFAERVQIVYQAETRSVMRKTVRVWDPSPEKNLDFVWEPAPGQPADGVSADGTINGEGRVVWRVRGSASYDPKTIFSTYTGHLKNGRPNGRGRFEIRSGEVVDGIWIAGVATGPAVWIDEIGNRYEGQLAYGRPQGRGRYLATNGAIFEGDFVAGLRQGEGRTTLPGGTVYRSFWDKGHEIGANRPDVLADARIGGLLKAQSGGGDAGKVEIGVVVEERMNQQSEMKYQHLVRDEDIAIYPVSDEINDYWNGTGSITAGDYVFSGIDWEQSPAFVEVNVGTQDGSRARIDSLELKGINSDSYRKPMLTLFEHRGCTGFRPSFSIVNHGWGEVRDAKLTLQFTGETEDGPMSRAFEQTIDTFDSGTDVSVRDMLDQAGVDTGKLENNRYNCQSMDSINVCRSQVFNDVGFGEVADYVAGEDMLYTTIAGKLDYSWADAAGNVYAQSEGLRATIALATIETPRDVAECGDGFGGSPEAIRFQDVALRIDEHGYDVNMPIRGNKNITSYKARLKLSADQSSFHQFRVAAHFADGSTRESKPVSIFYFKPRPATFESTMKPAACYLNEVVGGC